MGWGTGKHNLIKARKTTAFASRRFSDLLGLNFWSKVVLAGSHQGFISRPVHNTAGPGAGCEFRAVSFLLLLFCIFFYLGWRWQFFARPGATGPVLALGLILRGIDGVRGFASGDLDGDIRGRLEALAIGYVMGGETCSMLATLKWQWT